MVKGVVIIYNVKICCVSVCNVFDCVIVYESRLFDLFFFCEKFKVDKVIIYVDLLVYQVFEGYYFVGLLKFVIFESFGIEFLDYKMVIKIVNSFENVFGYIQEYSL